MDSVTQEIVLFCTIQLVGEIGEQGIPSHIESWEDGEKITLLWTQDTGPGIKTIIMQ